MKWIASILFTLLISSILVACTNTGKSKMNKKLAWGVQFRSATIADETKTSKWISLKTRIYNFSPLYNTTFYAANGVWLRHVSGYTAGSWVDNPGSTMGGDVMAQPFPHYLDLYYHSNFERQHFRSIQQPLPAATLQQLFAQPYVGYWHKQWQKPEEDGYQRLVFGIAPQGYIVLFADGFAMRREVASFQAEPFTPISEQEAFQKFQETSGLEKHAWKELYFHFQVAREFIEQKKDYRHELAELSPAAYRTFIVEKKPLTSAWYQTMQVKYPWNVQVEAENGEWLNHYYDVEFANSERWQVFTEEAFNEDQRTLKAIPSAIQVWLRDLETGKKYRVIVFPFGTPKLRPYELARSYLYRLVYDDPNMNAARKLLVSLFPDRQTRHDNQRKALPNEFGTLRIKFNHQFELSEVSFEKDGKKVKLPNAVALGLREIGDDPKDFRWGIQ